MKRRFKESDADRRAELDRIESEVMEEHPPATEVEVLAMRLRQIREDAGLTLTELSARTGIDLGELSRIETGKRNPSWRTLTRYAAGLGRRAVLEFVEEP